MSRPPDAPTFFIDRDLGIRFAEHLAADKRFRIELHDTHFPHRAADDPAWLELIAKSGWIGVTHDKKIRSQHRAIIAAFGARVIIVVGNRPFAEQAANFLATFPRIQRLVRGHKGPYTAKLYYPAPVEMKKLAPKGRIALWGEQ
jgi:hypothetical protein